jgi:hypothetical protein
MAIEDQARGLPAQGPGARRRDRAGIDRIEVAPCRQRIQTPACRCTGSARRHEATGEAAQQAIQFGVAATVNDRCKHSTDEIEHGARPGPLGRAIRTADQLQR